MCFKNDCSKRFFLVLLKLWIFFGYYYVKFSCVAVGCLNTHKINQLLNDTAVFAYCVQWRNHWWHYIPLCFCVQYLFLLWVSLCSSLSDVSVSVRWSWRSIGSGRREFNWSLWSKRFEHPSEMTIDLVRIIALADPGGATWVRRNFKFQQVSWAGWQTNIHDIVLSHKITAMCVLILH